MDENGIMRFQRGERVVFLVGGRWVEGTFDHYLQPDEKIAVTRTASGKLWDVWSTDVCKPEQVTF